MTVRYNTILRTRHDFITVVVAFNKTNNLDRFYSCCQIIWQQIIDCINIHLLHPFDFDFDFDCKRVRKFRDFRVKQTCAVVAQGDYSKARLIIATGQRLKEE